MQIDWSIKEWFAVSTFLNLNRMMLMDVFYSNIVLLRQRCYNTVVKFITQKKTEECYYGIGNAGC